MTQPMPELPINVQHTNPYTGPDRGLFVTRGNVVQYARIHAARWKTNGPIAAVGILEYQIMAYSAKPVTAEDYRDGTLLPAPGGSMWFDTLTRGLVHEPIVAEYWAVNSYFTNYSTPEAVLLTEEEKTAAFAQNVLFVETMGQRAGLDSILLTIDFNITVDSPMVVSNRAMIVNYKVGEEARSMNVVAFPEVTFDPVHVALNAIKIAQG